MPSINYLLQAYEVSTSTKSEFQTSLLLAGSKKKEEGCRYRGIKPRGIKSKMSILLVRKLKIRKVQFDRQQIESKKTIKQLTAF